MPYFYGLENPETFDVHKGILRVTGTEIFKTHTTGITRENPNEVSGPKNTHTEDVQPNHWRVLCTSKRELQQ
jgi:hypothetical protein